MIRVAILIGLLLMGCSSRVGDCQKAGQKAFAEKYARLPDSEEMLAITKKCADRPQ